MVRQAYKMKFGHRGFNHAVREIATGRVDFTSQNHGYAIDREHTSRLPHGNARRN